MAGELSERSLRATSPCRRAQIKETCGYEALTEDIDLQKDVGGMVELHTHGRASAKELLTPKATYILCKMAVAEDAPEGTAPTPEMLWTPPEGYLTALQANDVLRTAAVVEARASPPPGPWQALACCS